MKSGREQHESREESGSSPIKVTDQMWREASLDGAKAKELLVNLEFSNGARVTFVQLENGNQIPVADVTEKQAQDFVAMLAPERCWVGARQ